MDTIRHLSAIPLFHGLPRNHMENLARIAIIKEYNPGEVIFFEGDEGSGFYVVISGRVKVYKLSPDGKEQILHIFGPREPFGEVAVFSGEPFPANSEAMEKSKIFFLPREDFIVLIQKDPSLALNMLAVLSRRLRQFTTLVESLSLKEAPGRLAAYLLYLSQKERDADTLTLDISKSQLASLLGTIPETLSRILSRMTKAGLIEADGSRSIRIRDRKGLEDLASSARRLA